MTLPTKRFVLLGLASPLFILNSQALAVESTKDSLSNCDPLHQKKKQVQHVAKKTFIIPQHNRISSNVLPKKVVKDHGCTLPMPPPDGMGPVDTSWRIMMRAPTILQPVTTAMVLPVAPQSLATVPEPSVILLTLAAALAFVPIKKQRFARPKENPRS
jgi:hypothetical protein